MVPVAQAMTSEVMKENDTWYDIICMYIVQDRMSKYDIQQLDSVSHY